MYKKVIDKINKSENQTLPVSSEDVKINPEHGKKIADAYGSMKHDPEHPEVKKAYSALIDETKQQFNDIMNKGLKVSRIEPGMENPYKNSKELHADIKNNNHLWYFPTDLGFGGDEKTQDHPMLQPTGIKHGDKELLANDVFRIVHDVNGHYNGGESGFGPTGEHKAYLTHKKMYSPLAGKALATETMGQNSWVNFGPHGEHNQKNPSQTVYAEQKAGLLPDEIVNGNWHADSVKKSENLIKNSNIEFTINEEINPLMNRKEEKFFLPAAKLQKFINLISSKLKEGDSDTFVRHNTNKTIYLDSRDLDSFRDNLEGIKPRFKVRIRQYKPNNEEWESTAYIELKVKTEEGITKKTRIRIHSYMIPEIEEGREIKSDERLEIINKDISKMDLWKRIAAINTVIQKYGFKKQLTVEYHRRAFSGKNIRITIDDSLKYYDFKSIDKSTGNSILNSKKWEDIQKSPSKVSDNDLLILEIKHEEDMPKWIEEIVSDFKLKPVSFSKYCASIVTHLKNGYKKESPIQRQKLNFDTNEIIDVLKTEELKNTLTSFMLKKHQEHPEIPVEELKKNFGTLLRNGVMLLGLAHAHKYLDSDAYVDSHKKNPPAAISQSVQETETDKRFHPLRSSYQQKSPKEFNPSLKNKFVNPNEPENEENEEE